MLSKDERIEIEEFIAAHEELPTEEAAIESALARAEAYMDTLGNSSPLSDPVLFGELVEVANKLHFAKQKLTGAKEKVARRMRELTHSEAGQFAAAEQAVVRYRKILADPKLRPSMRHQYQEALAISQRRLVDVVEKRIDYRQLAFQRKDLTRQIVAATARVENCKDLERKKTLTVELERLKQQRELIADQLD